MADGGEKKRVSRRAFRAKGGAARTQETYRVSSFYFLSNHHLALDRPLHRDDRAARRKRSLFSLPLPPSLSLCSSSTDEDAKSRTRGTIVIRHRDALFRDLLRDFFDFSTFLRSPYLKNKLVLFTERKSC